MTQSVDNLALNGLTVQKFGNNPDIDTASGFEDVWDGGGTWIEPQGNRIHQIKSTNINDTLGGTGAEKVRVTGHTTGHIETSEEVTLNGTANVATVNAYHMINRMQVIQSNNGGNDTYNAGTITATADTDSTVTAQIMPEHNQTLMAIYMVASNRTALLTRMFGAVASKNAVGVTFKMWIKPSGEPWQLRDIWAVSAGSGVASIIHDPPSKVDSMSLIRISADVDANNTSVSAGFDLKLWPK